MTGGAADDGSEFSEHEWIKLCRNLSKSAHFLRKKTNEMLRNALKCNKRVDNRSHIEDNNNRSH